MGLLFLALAVGAVLWQSGQHGSAHAAVATDTSLPSPSQVWGDNPFGGVFPVSGNTISYRDWLSKYRGVTGYTGSNWSQQVPDRPLGVVA